MIDITLHTTVAYAYFQLDTVKDPKKLFTLLLGEYQKGSVVNVIKSANILHAIFKTTEDFETFMQKHYPIRSIHEVAS